ncbi:sulfatase-like hydrolase/transferase [Pelagicoccus enzymogenes]|uniref:sulfatase-like hydrolase/transferase n=1 Tax=Pelagicoccus enzymogenes TaxID=2773457 RepID=UPI00280D22FD|nr:sulfatase-like hydrolase/transferase [Pelagicoccus enzymogenes]MDQ8198939.1 sulfatase-like hydrolase/transferase [Pelagicoccus enzymogenes]
MKRVALLTFLFLLHPSSLIHLTASTAGGTPPNFLMIAVDDLNHYNAILADQPGNFLRKIYPDTEQRAKVIDRIAPNIARLADQSTTFSYAFSPQPLCGPCRTAALTGLPPHISGYTEHSRHFRHFAAFDGVVTLPQYLRQNGYQTIGLGKIFHKPSVETKNGERHDWPDMAYSWDTWIERRMGMGGPNRAKRSISPYSPENGYFTFGASNTPTERSWDFLNAQFATELYLAGRAEITDLHGAEHHVSLPDDAPFLLAVGLFAPHMPWDAPPEFYDRFPTQEMTGIDASLIDWVDQDIADIPESVRKLFINEDFDLTLAAGARNGDSIEGWRRAVQAYLAATAYADHCLGQLIDAVETSSRKDNTVVMLFGDHGWQLGDKRRYRKHALWEGANHTTLIMRDPRRPASIQGAECDRMVSLQYLYPTLASLAGLPIPEHVHGYDMTPLLENPNAEFPEDVLMTNTEGNLTLRTQGWRYTRYRDGSQELYDMLADPYEYTNLVSDPQYKKQLQKLDQQLNQVAARNASYYRNELSP